jgi:hypothetical protein
MVSKCANPACSNSFRRLSEGKLFLVDRGEDACSRPQFKNMHWLCDRCLAAHHVVVRSGVPHVVLAPRERRERGARQPMSAAASGFD